MRTSQATQEGFIPKKSYKRIKQRTGKVYHFTRDPVGKVIKILIGLIGDRSTGHDLVMRRNFTKQGAGKMALYNQLIAIVPWFPKYYLEQRGVELTPSIISNRYHKMYWEDGKPVISKEHYFHDKKLRPFVPAVEKLFMGGGIISEDAARKIGSSQQIVLL